VRPAVQVATYLPSTSSINCLGLPILFKLALRVRNKALLEQPSLWPGQRLHAWSWRLTSRRAYSVARPSSRAFSVRWTVCSSLLPTPAQESQPGFLTRAASNFTALRIAAA